MDLTTLLGVALGICSLVIAFVLDGGHVLALLKPTAAMIVFGGTIGATAVGYTLEELKSVPRLFAIAFMEQQKFEVAELIQRLTGIADRARREGLLSLEQELPEISDSFLRQGLQLIIDGTDPELTRNMMETEMLAVEERHQVGIGMFEAAGGFAPTMGIIGTVMGLVHVLSNLQDPSSLGPSIALAFIATFYGVGSANLVWLPIANKLKNRSNKEKIVKEMVMEGILSIQAGENPTIIREKLLSFIPPAERVRFINRPGSD
ncbi:MAG: flagellar motor protein [Syntrophomonadaceae bacterium]|nr:flagellar motor protein [Syntrophomonadaceae bacterium]